MSESPSPMDVEQVVAAAQAAAGAAVNLLDLVQCDQAHAQHDLDRVAQHLAEALWSVLDWMPQPDEEQSHLRWALDRFLP